MRRIDGLSAHVNWRPTYHWLPVAMCSSTVGLARRPGSFAFITPLSNHLATHHDMAKRQPSQWPQGAEALVDHSSPDVPGEQALPGGVQERPQPPRPLAP